MVSIPNQNLNRSLNLTLPGIKIRRILIERVNSILKVKNSFTSKILTISKKNFHLETIKEREEVFKRYKLTGHQFDVYSIEYSECEKFLLSGDLNGSIFLWYPTRGKIIGNFLEHNGPVWDIKVQKGGNNFLSSGRDMKLILWNLTKNSSYRYFYGHTSDINEMKFYRNNSFFGSVSDDKSVKIWDIREKKCIKTLNCINMKPRSLDFSHNGYEVSFSGTGRFIDSWDLRADRFLRRISLKGKVKKIDQLNYSKCSDFLLYLKNDQNVMLSSLKISEQKKIEKINCFLNQNYGMTTNANRMGVYSNFIYDDFINVTELLQK